MTSATAHHPPTDVGASSTALLIRRVADQDAVIDALIRLTAGAAGADPIDVLLSLAEELCAPEAVGFIPGRPGPIDAPLVRPATPAASTAVAGVAASLRPDRSWQVSDAGIAVRVSTAGADLGVLAVTAVAFPEHAEDWAQALLRTAPAVARAITRRPEGLPATRVGAPVTDSGPPADAGDDAGLAPSVLEQIDILRLQGIAQARPVTVTVIRLEGLHAVQARHGWRAGTQVLAEAEQRLASQTRECDVVGRLTCRELVVAQLLPPGCAGLPDRLIRALQAPYELSEGATITCTARAGVVTAEMIPAPVEVLVARAQAALERHHELDALARQMPAHDGLQTWWPAVMAAINDGVVVQAPDGRVLYANAAAAAILDLDPGTLTGAAAEQPGWQPIRRDGTPIPFNQCPWARAAATMSPVTDQVIGIARPNSDTTWVMATSVPIATTTGHPVHVITTVTDVTGESNARQALLDHTARLRRAIDAFPTPFFILDAVRDHEGAVVELRYAHLNTAAAQLYGCNVEDVIGRGQIELFPSVVELGLFDRYVHVIESGQTDTIEIPWFDENGVHGSFEVVASRLGDSIVLTATEISERRALVSQLAASEARFLSAFGDASVPMALIQAPQDSQARIVVRVNRSMSTFFGMSDSELTGPQTEATHPGLGRIVTDLDDIAQAARHGRTLDFQFTHADGHTLWAEVHLSELSDPVAGSQMWLLQCTDTTEWHRMEDEFEYHTRHDALTGLPNRSLLLEELGSALDRVKSPVGVLVLNIDDFKSVNTDLGLDAGDAYLKGCAELLGHQLKPGQLLARLGGDEFALLIPDARDARRLGLVADRVMATLANGIPVGGEPVSVSVSIGAALRSRRGTTPEALLALAGTAMLEAKARGGNRWAMATMPRATSTTGILSLEADLREAVSTGGLSQRYQPVFDLRTGRLESVEALTRWVHPTRGIIPPEEFISIAERRNIIGALGDWALDTACAQARSWRDRFGNAAPTMAVNVSTRQLGNNTLPARVARLLHDNTLPAEDLWLEVTESQAIAAGGLETAELIALRELGVRIAIDDFGTGHAGFAYLRTLPADGLKIDKSFIDHVDTDRTAAAIATSMVALSHGLGLTVVAEGIETLSQLAVMRALGADHGQGWLWRPALTATDLETLIDQPETALRTT